MDCPVDGTTLAMTSREGVEIDYCPQCRGVWLDRGELDKVIQRAATETAPAPVAPRYDDRPPPRYDDRPPPRYDDDRRYDKRRKRRSLLEDLFDFD
jgi:Zn-finger nucleic acid-binding protein